MPQPQLHADLLCLGSPLRQSSEAPHKAHFPEPRKGAPSRVQADAPFLSFVLGGSAAALLPKSESFLQGWRVADYSYEDAFGTDPEPGTEDLGAR